MLTHLLGRGCTLTPAGPPLTFQSVSLRTVSVKDHNSRTQAMQSKEQKDNQKMSNVLTYILKNNKRTLTPDAHVQYTIYFIPDNTNL